MHCIDWDHRTISQWLSLQRAPVKLRREILTWWQQTGEQQIPLTRTESLPTAPAAEVQRVFDWLGENSSHFLLSYHCADYPQSLREIYRPPILLFGIGDKALLNRRLLAVIGSRKASPLALSLTEAMVTDLCKAGWGIVSGMALGIDGLAHRTALAMQLPTIAVLGCGPDLNYPPRNRALRQEICAQGVVLSEYMPGTPAKTEHFPARNRIISGISAGVLVAEANVRSGSLITARYAIEQGREVFAIPGPVPHPGSAGCHLLIQQGAKLVTCAADIISELPGWPANTAANGQQQLELATKSGESVPKLLANAELLANVGYETTSFDWLLQQTNDSVSAVVNQLISLELDGWIKTVPGGYVRVRR